jgi:hypothetical protein
VAARRPRTFEPASSGRGEPTRPGSTVTSVALANILKRECAGARTARSRPLPPGRGRARRADTCRRRVPGRQIFGVCVRCAILSGSPVRRAEFGRVERRSSLPGEQRLAGSVSASPLPVVPGCTAQVVRRVEKLPDRHTTKGGDASNAGLVSLVGSWWPLLRVGSWSMRIGCSP